MPPADMTGLAREWEVLQSDCERYEHGGLMVKLLAVLLSAGTMLPGMNPGFACVLLAILWLQEGIFRTFQFRLADRIIQIEGLLRKDSSSSGAAFQLHSTWLAQRPGVAGLLREYIGSALRPTVAFPYVVLILTIALFRFV